MLELAFHVVSRVELQLRDVAPMIEKFIEDAPSSGILAAGPRVDATPL